MSTFYMYKKLRKVFITFLSNYHMEDKFKARINYSGGIEDISLQICEDYDLGKFKSNKLILMGYEDFNFILETSKGKYFVKVFAKHRDLGDCKRYIEIMGRAFKANVSVPKLLESNQRFLYFKNINKTNIRLCVAEFISGKTLFELKEELNKDEIKFIAKQISLINSIKLKPKFMDDEWAITNFLKEFKKKKGTLSKEDLELIEPLVKKFKDMKIEELPHCFVHGDIIVTNVMKDSNDKLWIIDFSVSNYYPRIQELAVLACNLFFDEDNKEESDKNMKIALEEYQKKIKLTEKELDSLETYIKLAHAMHLLSANFEKVKMNNNSEENEYWINQGKKGLMQN